MDMLVDYSDDDDDDHSAAASASSTPVTLPMPSTALLAPPIIPPPSLLPSAAQLFDTPASSASTSTSSLPRKRPQVNGSAHPSHQSKVPRSNSSSARTPPGSTLVPPQLRGRSNVATEDLDKLFVQRQQRSEVHSICTVNSTCVAIVGSKLLHRHLVTSPKGTIILNSQHRLKLTKLEDAEFIRRVGSRGVPSNKSLSSQHCLHGDGAAAAPFVLNRGVRSPISLKARSIPDTRTSSSNQQVQLGASEMVGNTKVKGGSPSEVSLDDNTWRRRLNTTLELREFKSKREREHFSLQWNVFDLLPPDSSNT